MSCRQLAGQDQIELSHPCTCSSLCHSPPQCRAVPCLQSHYRAFMSSGHSLSSSAPISRRPGFSAASPPLCPATFQTWDGLPSLCAFPSAGNSHPTESAGAASTTTETPAPRSLHWEAFPTLCPSSHVCAHGARRAPPGCAGAGHLCLTSCAGSAAGSLFHFGISSQKSVRNPWVVQKKSQFMNKGMGFLVPKSVRLRLWHLPFESGHFFRRLLFQLGQGLILLESLVV